MIVIIAIVGVFVFSQPQATTQDGKINTQINFLSADSLQNGESIQFELKEVTGAAIAGESVKITYAHDGQNETYSIITDSQGKGYLVINGEDDGSYDVTVDYAGNAKYNGCNAKKTVTIKETDDEVADTNEETESNSTASTVMYNQVNSTSSSSSSSSSDDNTSQENHDKEYVSQLYYDENLGVYYDDFGTIHGGEHDGDEIALVRDPTTNETRYPEGYDEE